MSYQILSVISIFPLELHHQTLELFFDAHLQGDLDYSQEYVCNFIDLQGKLYVLANSKYILDGNSLLHYNCRNCYTYAAICNGAIYHDTHTVEFWTKDFTCCNLLPITFITALIITEKKTNMRFLLLKLFFLLLIEQDNPLNPTAQQIRHLALAVNLTSCYICTSDLSSAEVLSLSLEALAKVNIPVTLAAQSSATYPDQQVKNIFLPIISQVIKDGRPDLNFTETPPPIKVFRNVDSRLTFPIYFTSQR